MPGLWGDETRKGKGRGGYERGGEGTPKGPTAWLAEVLRTLDLKPMFTTPHPSPRGRKGSTGPGPRASWELPLPSKVN